MNFADQWATDEAGNRFLFTVAMQRRLDEAGLPIVPESLTQLDDAPPVQASRPRSEPVKERRQEPSIADDDDDDFDDDDDDFDDDGNGDDDYVDDDDDDDMDDSSDEKADVGNRRDNRREKRDEDEFQPATVQIDPESGKYIGRLKWYNPGRGYGFIARGAGEDIFFHRSDMTGDPETVAEGSWLLYDVEETQKGLEASEIEIYSGDPSQLL